MGEILMPASGLVFTGRSGCFLPILIMFNLFFGRFIFDSTSLWLGVEGILVLLFIIKINTFARKISEQLKPETRRRGKVIDVHGEEVKET